MPTQALIEAAVWLIVAAVIVGGVSVLLRLGAPGDDDTPGLGG